MSFLVEVYSRPPANTEKEAAPGRQVTALDGRLDHREEVRSGANSICLPYEFDDWDSARAAAERLREQGEHVEGPVDYGE